MALCAISILFSAYCIYDFSPLVRKTHMGAVINEISVAADVSHKGPPGIQRAEVFLMKIKAIRMGYAPDEFKRAMQDYISGFEQSLAARKAGQDTGKIDARIAEAKQRMAECYRQYE